jgi:mannose-6-phosphate isomerase
MVNTVRNYDWGSTTTLARLQHRPPTGRPEAELWMGAHPSAPSRLVRPDHVRLDLVGQDHVRLDLVELDTGAGADADTGGLGLDRIVTERPVDLLGTEVFGRFGPRLPFLLKILAISRPLSVQVHPTADRARAAFEGEADVPGEHRYVDPYPKPELLYALEAVDALCGFRSALDAERLLSLVGGRRMARLAEALRGDGEEGDRIEGAFEQLVTWPDSDRAALAAEVGATCRRLLSGAGSLRTPPGTGDIRASDRRALTWAARLSDQHPHDPLVAAPFLLDLVHLQPGDTLFVPAGAPHAYLHGLGVEVMGNSDNVLRAGLTHKPIAVEELLHVVHGGSRPQQGVPATWVSPHEVVWSPGVPEFRLSRARLLQAPVTAYPDLVGPQIILCTAGTVRVACGGHAVELAPGRSAFVGDGGGPVTLTGPGEIFRAFAGAALTG